MSVFQKILMPLIAAVFLSGCVPVQNPAELPPVTQTELSDLENGILALGPDVDPEEAKRAALIAFEYPRELAVRYNVTDTPLTHNTKVNTGLRSRGLCWHWADDLEARLAQENFQTLDLHRAIGNSRKPWRIEHSTVLIGHKGSDLNEALVLDPWRNGGLLFWALPLEDKRYDWLPVEVVFAERRAKEAKKGL